jgi:hypothetical protein
LTGATRADPIGIASSAAADRQPGNNVQRETLIMPLATGNSGTSPDIAEQDVFVLELDGSPTFAFGAAENESASEIIRSDWFKAAIDGFLSDRPVTDSAVLLRPATNTEASVFHDLADEFAEPTMRFFVAHLPAHGLEGGLPSPGGR